jgi:hypothetical protein
VNSYVADSTFNVQELGAGGEDEGANEVVFRCSQGFGDGERGGAGEVKAEMASSTEDESIADSGLKGGVAAM